MTGIWRSAIMALGISLAPATQAGSLTFGDSYGSAMDRYDVYQPSTDLSYGGNVPSATDSSSPTNINNTDYDPRTYSTGAPVSSNNDDSNSVTDGGYSFGTPVLELDLPGGLSSDDLRALQAGERAIASMGPTATLHMQDRPPEVLQTFFNAVHEFYKNLGLDPRDQNVPSGIVQMSYIERLGGPLLRGRISDLEYNLTWAIDEEMRNNPGGTEVYAPGVEIDSSIKRHVETMHNQQKLGALDTVIVKGNSKLNATIQGMDGSKVSPTMWGFSSAAFFDIATGGLVFVENISNAELSKYGVPVDADTWIAASLGHELIHASDYSIWQESEQGFYDGVREDEIAHMAVFSMFGDKGISTDENGKIVENAQVMTVDGVVSDNTLVKIRNVNPKFAKEDQYMLQTYEMLAWSHAHPDPQVNKTLLEFTLTKRGLTASEAQAAARIIMESPAVNGIFKTKEEYAAKMLQKRGQ